MTSLAAGDSSVGAVCAWHSIIHIPDEHLAAVFEEFHRVVVLGLYRRVGWKRGSWHDVAWTQLDLLGPAYHSDSPIPIN